jgi:hypothetical protein
VEMRMGGGQNFNLEPELDTPWLDSVLRRTARRLAMTRYRRALEVIKHLPWVESYGGVMDLVLLTFRADLAPAARAYYADRGPTLSALLAPKELAALDRTLEEAVCQLACVYNTLRRQAKGGGQSKTAVLDWVVQHVGLRVPPASSSSRQPSMASPPAVSPLPPSPAPPPAGAPTFTVSLTKDTIYDRARGLTWQRGRSDALLTWAEALAHAAGLVLQGTGWRLPSRADLESLMAGGRLHPEAARVFADGFRGWFWSGIALHEGHAWAASPSTGESELQSAEDRYWVRCVRQG